MKFKLIHSYPNSPALGTESTSDYSKYPEFWERVKEPLVISEEKTPIYEGDTYYVVFDKINQRNPNWFFVNGPFKAVIEKNTEFSTDAKYFINTATALKYIHDYKPALSVADVNTVYTQLFNQSLSVNGLVLANKLIQLIESKI
jgi:hypothetical protein